jgi:hypothetical protein
MKLGVLGLASLLLLTGCGSSPSAEDQIKVIEYENCLKMFIERSNVLIQSRTSSPISPFGTNSNYQYNFQDFESVLENCASYRP